MMANLNLSFSFVYAGVEYLSLELLEGRKRRGENPGSWEAGKLTFTGALISEAQA
jgi:hypothetical protein